jgi:hypothetical protein
MPPASEPHRRLTRRRLSDADRTRTILVNDLVVILLGTGAILLMCAYAELCERI